MNQMNPMKDYIALYKDILNTRLHNHNISVYGISNVDIEYNINSHRVTKLLLFLNNKIRRIIGNKQFGEFSVSSEESDTIINQLKKSGVKGREIPGGNAANIALALGKLNNDISLTVKHFPNSLLAFFKGIKVTHKDYKESTHLIFQIGNDRLILSSDFNDKEPQLMIDKAKSSDMTIYSGAHLDAPSVYQQKSLFRRLEELRTNSKILYFEFGDVSTHRLSMKNCLASAKVSDIVGLNDKELKEVIGDKGKNMDFVEASILFYKKYLKSDKILIMHTSDGNLVVSDKYIENIQKAQALASLTSASRVKFGRFLSLGEIRNKFKNIRLNKPIKPFKNKDIKESNLVLSWVPSLRVNVKRSVGAGDAFTAGFAKGVLEFCD